MRGRGNNPAAYSKPRPLLLSKDCQRAEWLVYQDKDRQAEVVCASDFESLI
jgi:hypothetical protein